MKRSPISAVLVALAANESKAYWVAALLGGGCCVIWTIVLSWSGITPAEDAFILFRYAANVASGHGFVWNLGGPHAEGATDFLWLCCVSAVTVVTNSPVSAAYLLSSGCVIGLGMLLHVYLRGRRRFPVVIFALAIGCYLGSPLLIHLINGFSPPMFTLLLLLSTILMMDIMNGIRTHLRLILWGTSLLAIGLTRPEGNVFCVCQAGILMNQARSYDRRMASKLWLALLTVYVIPGLTYFALRYQYFGLLFPLPFYVKGINQSSPFGSLQINTVDLLIHLGLPLVGAGLILLRGCDSLERPSSILLATVPAVFLLLGYLPISQSQNVSYRFQYPAFAVIIFLCIEHIGELTTRKNNTRWMVAAVLLVISVAWITVTSVPIPERPGSAVSIGSGLARYVNQGYTLATTESGKLPYFSQWKTLDSDGLNDSVVATMGLSYEYWKAFSPTIVMIHPTQGWDIYKDALPLDDGGHRRELIEHMRSDGFYQLAAVIERVGRSGRVRPNDYDLYFISTRCPDYTAIRDILRSVQGATYRNAPSVLVDYLMSTAPH